MNIVHRWYCKSDMWAKQLTKGLTYATEGLDLGDNLLEIGPGPGVATGWFKERVAHVTAVEIDPTIYALGKALHPERPYDAPQVEVVVSDARTYLSRPPNDEPFDMIVFGLLDSHTQVSGMTSLRLDNFVYTQESLAQARELLHPQRGVLALSFSAAWDQSPWTLRRIHRMLTLVFDKPPRVAFTGYDMAVSFLAGPGSRQHPFFESAIFKTQSEAALQYVDPILAALETPATDDWPFLYLENRAVPLEYWLMMALIAVVSAGWVWSAIRGQTLGRFSLHFFLLGSTVTSTMTA